MNDIIHYLVKMKGQTIIISGKRNNNKRYVGEHSYDKYTYVMQHKSVN